MTVSSVLFSQKASNLDSTWCLSYWLLFALSSFASLPNFIAMYYIGGEYIRISNQRDKSWRECDVLFTRFAMLSAQNPTSSSPGTSPFVPTSSSPGTPPFLSAPTSPVAGTAPPSPAGTAPSPSPVAATAPPPSAGNHGYIPRRRMRIFFVAFFIAFYLGVSAIMYLVCIKTLHKPGAQCKQH
ncbi:hypothetical protein Pyn_13187 [Prunus yedoensis var. nudiflora]|uniref:Uncharacterized protein n=1 Tax=Prunus yedoensis var. nudiflora TaxID=2094558 RepID=A0A314UHZ2_PRUYE|nr:hypothetical protein Pyn_13187 [Prunus yedoensis var. nudiflora]